MKPIGMHNISKFEAIRSRSLVSRWKTVTCKKSMGDLGGEGGGN